MKDSRSMEKRLNSLERSNRLLMAVVLVVTAGALLAAVLCLNEPGSLSPEFLPPPGADAQKLPFSEAVRVGDLLLLSGKVGRSPDTGKLVDGGIQAETRQTMENIKAVLERHGSSLDQVVKCTVFLADIDEWPAMNEVYRTYFPSHPPARSALAANGLAFGAAVEIECLAALD